MRTPVLDFGQQRRDFTCGGWDRAGGLHLVQNIIQRGRRPRQDQQHADAIAHGRLSRAVPKIARSNVDLIDPNL